MLIFRGVGFYLATTVPILKRKKSLTSEMISNMPKLTQQIKS
jgi:hypothetical protein